MSLPDFASLVRDLLAERGMSQRALAREIPINAGQLSRVLNRERLASEEVASRCDEVFDTGCRLAEAAQRDRATRRLTRKAPTAMAGRHAPPAGRGSGHAAASRSRVKRVAQQRVRHRTLGAGPVRA
jgi:plasmid maintenance system antidote protein VapI